MKLPLFMLFGMFGFLSCLASDVSVGERGLHYGGEFRPMVRYMPKIESLISSFPTRPGQPIVTTSVSTGRFYQLNAAIAGQIGYNRATFRAGPAINYYFGGNEGPATLRPKSEARIGWMVEGEYAVWETLSFLGGYDQSSARLLFTPPPPFLPEARIVAKAAFNHYYGGVRWQPKKWFGILGTMGAISPSFERDPAIPSSFGRKKTDFMVGLGGYINFSWSR